VGRPALNREPHARPAGKHSAKTPMTLDRLIHERLRLGIVSALAVNDSLTFNELKHLLQTTDGNLSVHARKLEDADYVACDKTFEGRVPRTAYRLTAAGRRAFDRYLAHMEAIIKAVKPGEQFAAGTSTSVRNDPQADPYAARTFGRVTRRGTSRTLCAPLVTKRQPDFTIEQLRVLCEEATKLREAAQALCAELEDRIRRSESLTKKVKRKDRRLGPRE